MKLPSFKRLYYTDYPKENQELVEQMSYTINNGFESINDTLDNNVSLRDNLFATVRDVDVSTDASGNPTSTAAFSVDNSNPIDGLTVIKHTNKTNSLGYPTSGISISYTQSGTKVTINNVTGLIPNNVYSLRVVAYLT